MVRTFLSFPLSSEELTCRSLCGCASSSRPHARPCPSAPHGCSCSRLASPLCSTFACCQADYLCNMGVIFGLLDVAGRGVLCPRKRNIFSRSSWAKARCPLARNQLSLVHILHNNAHFFTIPNSHHGISLHVVMDYSPVCFPPRRYACAPCSHEASSSVFLQDIDYCQRGHHGCTCPPLVLLYLIV